MADKKTMSDEDYLDSLLKSITGSENSKDEEYKDKDESDFAKALEKEIGLKDDEDTFLNDIENDLFANGEVLSEAGQEDDDEDNSIDEVNGYEALTDTAKSNDDLNVAEVDNKKKKKNTKKGLFGRNKKIVISDNSDNTDENQAEKQAEKQAENQTESQTEKQAEKQRASIDTTDNSNTPEDTVTENTEAEDFDDFSLDFGNDYNDNFDMEFDEDNASKSEGSLNEGAENPAEETPENQVSDLMNIMGITEEDEEAGEENKGKPKKKKKEKTKNKKGFFSKHKKEKDSESELGGDLEKGVDFSDNEAQMGNSSDNVDINANESGNADMFNLDAIANNAESDDYSFGLDMDFGEEENQDLDENENLIRQMDRGEIDEEEILSEEGKEEKGKKKEKKKKEKKSKKPKVKKVKAPRVKKPKEPDEIIPIPKVLLIFSFSFIVLLVICLIFGGNLKYYNEKMQRATTFYVNKDYEAAYGEISGLSIREKDQDFYNQVFTVMLVSHQYTAGKNLLAVGDYEQALHSYLKGIAMYDKYQNQARDLNCLDEMNGVLEQLNKELNDTFGLTESKARELNLLDNKEEYAYKVKVLAKEIMEKNQEKNSK